jgi:Family of unknown function (DUF6062)
MSETPPLLDVFNYDIVAAFARPGCPLCRVVAAADVAWVDAFWREGKSSPAARRAFYGAGGFCRRHAWLLHRLVAEAESGAAIADLYGALAEHDLERLRRVAEQIRRGRRRPRLEREHVCPACIADAESAARKADFLVQALRQAPIRGMYLRSDGLCLCHLRLAVEAAQTHDREIALLLVEDHARRLGEVRAQLADFDRKRDFRYAAEPKGSEQRSWTDVIELYVGRVEPES